MFATPHTLERLLRLQQAAPSDGEVRVILMLRLKRPLRFPGSALRDLLFAALRASPFVRDGLRNLERWERSKERPSVAAEQVRRAQTEEQ